MKVKIFDAVQNHPSTWTTKPFITSWPIHFATFPCNFSEVKAHNRFFYFFFVKQTMKRIMCILDFENKNIRRHILHNLCSSGVSCFLELLFAKDDLTWHLFTSNVEKKSKIGWWPLTLPLAFLYASFTTRSGFTVGHSVCLEHTGWGTKVNREDTIIPPTMLTLVLLWFFYSLLST